MCVLKFEKQCSWPQLCLFKALLGKGETVTENLVWTQGFTRQLVPVMLAVDRSPTEMRNRERTQT